ncbi:hypothetical protein Enr13x_20260 [Stieleria neptunia]|uniref:Uncharacterized protein n=1 Tax=Stieleria neptunia TaxID=2527979 RepID=A0A518HMW1_9BACT|nr:hypothetical protein [Stieleria neptunia]QDV42183.1 hypothetical protein Enr13x_20260 [Stieleria neptunia]
MPNLEEVIALKLSETLLADKSVKVSKGGAEERRQVDYRGYTFQVSRGHAYRDHATGPATNPRFSGPDKSVEKAIMDDAIRRIEANAIPKVTGIASPGTGVLVHGVPIRYNLVRIKKGAAGFMYMISDYMVWQGDPDALQKL